MSMGAVREPRRTVRDLALAERRRREFRDVRHPLRPELRIERVLVAPSGVHVVTSAEATTPAGRSMSRTAADSGGRRPPVVGAAELAATRAAADVVTALMPERYRGRVRPVLCCPDDVAVAEHHDGVLVASPDTLQHIVASSPVVLSTSEVNEITLRLGAHLEPYPVVPRQRAGRWRGRPARAALGLLAVPAAAALLAGLDVVTLPW